MDYLLTTASKDTGPGADLSYITPDGSYGQGFVSLRAVPEPSSLLLSCVGLFGLLGIQWRRKLRRQLKD
jgi:hypothetical protein